jgi:hypothetical protein
MGLIDLLGGGGLGPTIAREGSKLDFVSGGGGGNVTDYRM